MLLILNVLLFLLQCIFGFGVGYLLLLTLASLRAPRVTRITQAEPSIKFAILIPAYNEERLLPSCLESLNSQDYPLSGFSIHVVADNCTDQTSQVAEQGQAHVHVRYNPNQRGKGYALQWLFGKLRQSGEAFDAVVILDADSVVSPNFLRVMAARLQRGEYAIQSYYTVRSAELSWSGSLRYAALAVLHFLRPQGRMVLGGSAGLKGNGMVFVAGILDRHAWSASVTEDIEYHMSLILDGIRVTFAPDALVQGEMPDTLARSESQHARWESGRLKMARKYVPVLLRAAARGARRSERKRAFLLFDAVMEHVIPPFSLLMGIGVALWALDLLAFIASSGLIPLPFLSATALSVVLARINLFLGTGLLAVQIFYLFTGLVLARAPGYIYKSLLFAPVLIVWKIVNYVRILMGREPHSWVRTSRNES